MGKTEISTKQQVFYFQWHITDLCNLCCSHCYQVHHSSESDMTLEELKEIADKLLSTISKWGKKGDFSITGGEPFLRKDLFEFLKYLDTSEHTSNIDILTNGMFISERTIKELLGLSKLNGVQISLDGACEKSHDAVRSTGSFKKAINGIRTLVDAGFKVKIMFTLQKSNVQEVPDIIDLAIKEKVEGLTIERLVPTGNALKMKDSLVSPHELKDIFQYISNRADIEYKNGTKLRILKYRPLWINIDPCRAMKEVHPHEELGAICSIGLDGICILPDASVLACRRLPIPIGNLKSDTLEKIWFNSDLLWQIGDKSNLKGKCNSCDYIARCSGCRAIAYACTGDYLSEDPQCWK